MGAYLLALLADGSAVAQQRVITTMLRAGADSPRTARTIVELDVVTDAAWDHLIREGRVREGPPDHFYLFGIKRASPRQRAIKMTVFFVLIVAIPFVEFYLTRR